VREYNKRFLDPKKEEKSMLMYKTIGSLCNTVTSIGSCFIVHMVSMRNSNDAHERRPEKAAGKIVLFLLVGLRRLFWRVMRGVRRLQGPLPAALYLMFSGGFKGVRVVRAVARPTGAQGGGAATRTVVTEKFCPA
jgi:hypothetical protein